MTDSTFEPTQTERIRRILSGGFPICGIRFLNEYMPTYSQRIGELKRKGYDIERVSCPYPYHTHPRGIATYQMVLT